MLSLNAEETRITMKRSFVSGLPVYWNKYQPILTNVLLYYYNDHLMQTFNIRLTSTFKLGVIQFVINYMYKNQIVIMNENTRKSDQTYR